MRNLLIFLFAMSVFVWSIPKPMESIENYNVMLIHGAYESGKGVAENSEHPSAYDESDYYNDDVDKIITLDSPHEGTGALNMQVCLLLFCSKIRRKRFKENRV